MLINQQIEKLRTAFREGKLLAQSVSPEGQVEWKKIVFAARNEIPWEEIRRVETSFGGVCLTTGHRVFVSPTNKVESGEIQITETVLGVDEQGKVFYPVVQALSVESSRTFMYDLTVEDWHNFVLHESRIVVSNSPDRNYHFRPPEFEGDVGQYNRIFGQIWEDAELLEYIERALDWFNMLPPNTGGAVPSVEALVMSKPQWRTAILWGAIVHACFALATNWISEEFSLRGDQSVRVILTDGTEVDIPIGELYEVCKGC